MITAKRNTYPDSGCGGKCRKAVIQRVIRRPADKGNLKFVIHFSKPLHSGIRMREAIPLAWLCCSPERPAACSGRGESRRDRENAYEGGRRIRSADFRASR